MDTDTDSESVRSDDEMECWCCEETKMRKEFCDHKDEKGRTCLSCDEDMINCAECGDCPTMFYKDAVEIDSNWYCKDCAKKVTPHTIYVLSDGETWSTEGEIRQATKDDVKSWFGLLTEGQTIFCVDEDFEISDDGKTMTIIQITDEELEELKHGSLPRHLDNYYDRVDLFTLTCK